MKYKSQLLIEEIDLSLIESVVNEDKAGNKSYVIKGPFMEADQENRNKRVYPHQILKPQIESYQSVIKGNRAVGQLNHPETMEIDPAEIAIKIEKLEWADKHTVYGEAKVCSTPRGMIIRNLMDDGIKFGVSSRGAGTLREGIVQNDYKYVCNDVVWEPSARSAMVENIMEAKSMWLVEDGMLCEKQLDDIQSGLNDTKGKPIEEAMEDAFAKIMKFTTKNIIKNI